jgi:hypothetical protein
MQHQMFNLAGGAHSVLTETREVSVIEAAIVTAGFEYRPVLTEDNCPDCFSRPIASYAISLNDYMPDRLRQELLTPLITRLANTAGKKEIEDARAEFIVLETCRRIFSMFCTDVLKRPDIAENCRNANNTKEGSKICMPIVRDICPDYNSYPTCSPSRWRALSGSSRVAYSHAKAANIMHYSCLYARQGSATMAASTAAWAIRNCYNASSRRKRYFRLATQILDEAIMLGDHRANTAAR